MGFQLDISVPGVTVFLQGILSFFSPCVLPLIPLYIGYLSGGTGQRGEDGRLYYARKKVMIHTLFFVIGVSFAFFILGFGVSALGSFFKSNQLLFARIGGMLIILFGLYQFGLFGSSKLLGEEHRLPFKLDVVAMSPVTALLMGFTFSFAWTPCVGPALASVLILAASAGTRFAGFSLVGVYTLGFVLPFLAVGLFTTSLLEFFKKNMRVVKYTVKIGALLMILMGFLMFTGKMNGITGYLSGISSVPGSENEVGSGKNEADGTGIEDDVESAGENNMPATGGEDGTSDNEAASENEEATTENVLPAVDFELYDQYGNVHRLEDYKGKTIFLNFWATWCPPCRREMPDIQKLYETYETEGDEALIVLGVAAPLHGNEQSEEEITIFLEENGYTYPVLMDTENELFMAYGVYSYPTTYMIDRDGNVFGYVSGQISYEMMESIVKQTMSGKRE